MASATLRRALAIATQAEMTHHAERIRQQAAAVLIERSVLDGGSAR